MIPPYHKNPIFRRLADYLMEVEPGLGILTPAQRSYVSGLALDEVRGNRRHRYEPDSSVLFSSDQKMVFNTAGEFHRFNDQVGWFQIGKYSIGKARSYRLTDQRIEDHIGQFLVEDATKPRPLTNWWGRPIRRPPNAIVCKDSNGRTRKTLTQLSSSMIRVDLDNIRKWQETHRCYDTRRRHMSYALLGEANIEGFEVGWMRQQYRESASGRIMGMGYHLQNIKKELRNAALAGQFDYDIEACHPTLMYQLARSRGLRLRRLETMVEDKHTFRANLIERHHITAKQAKTALNALTYGASLTDRRKFALFDILGERASGFVNDPLIKVLNQELREARNIILSTTQSNGRCTKNILGKCINGRSKNSRVTHVITGYEALALNLAIEHLDGRLTLLVHDGFVSPVRIDSEFIASLFKQRSGLRIRYKETQLPVS